MQLAAYTGTTPKPADPWREPRPLAPGNTSSRLVKRSEQSRGSTMVQTATPGVSGGPIEARSPGRRRSPPARRSSFPESMNSKHCCRSLQPCLRRLSPSQVRPETETETEPASFPVQVLPGAGQASQTQTQTPQSSALSQAGGYAVHVVRRHETLRSIARDRLGDPQRSGELTELNRDVLGPGGQLTVGQRLILPANAMTACLKVLESAEC